MAADGQRNDMRGSAKATLAGVKKEMAKSRVAKSARKDYGNLGLPMPTIKPRKLPGREQAKKSFQE
jgi:hypothetical protein